MSDEPDRAPTSAGVVVVVDLLFVGACFGAFASARERGLFDVVTVLAATLALAALVGLWQTHAWRRPSGAALALSGVAVLGSTLVWASGALAAPMALATLVAAVLAVAGGVTLVSAGSQRSDDDLRQLRSRLWTLVGVELAFGAALFAIHREPTVLDRLDATAIIPPWPDGGVTDASLPDAPSGDVPSVDRPPHVDEHRDVTHRDRVGRDASVDRPIADLPPGDAPPSDDIVGDDVAPLDASDDVPLHCPSGMVPVPEGDPLLGDPAVRTHVSAFCIDRTEVTVARYRAWLRHSADDAGVPSTASQYCNWSEAPGSRENHPINCVDWHQASAYCRGTGGSLPTDAQWEYAARGTDGRPYPWGTAEPSGQLCWSGGGTQHDGTCRVGAFPSDVSPFGALDMGGNVWEWTDARGVRGGSWSNTSPRFVRAADRYEYGGSNRSVYPGFRCVRGSR